MSACQVGGGGACLPARSAAAGACLPARWARVVVRACAVGRRRQHTLLAPARGASARPGASAWPSALCRAASLLLPCAHVHPLLRRIPAVPWACAANELNDVIAPSCYSCFDYPNATGVCVCVCVYGPGSPLASSSCCPALLCSLAASRIFSQPPPSSPSLPHSSLLLPAPRSSPYPPILPCPALCSRPGDWLHGGALPEHRHDLTPAVPYGTQPAGPGAAGLGCGCRRRAAGGGAAVAREGREWNRDGRAGRGQECRAGRAAGLHRRSCLPYGAQHALGMTTPPAAAGLLQCGTGWWWNRRSPAAAAAPLCCRRCWQTTSECGLCIPGRAGGAGMRAARRAGLNWLPACPAPAPSVGHGRIPPCQPSCRRHPHPIRSLPVPSPTPLCPLPHCLPSPPPPLPLRLLCPSASPQGQAGQGPRPGAALGGQPAGLGAGAGGPQGAGVCQVLG